MNKNKQTATAAALTKGIYTAPAVKVVGIHSEGVLCISMNMLLQQDMGHEEWLEHTFSW